MPKREVGLNQLARATLNKFIEFLNKWDEDEKRTYPAYEGYEFKWEDFFKYDETKLLKDFEVSSYGLGPERIIVMQAGTGDEGGPSLLIAKFVKDDVNPGRPKDGSWHMRWLLQEFDTMGQLIWSDGKWQNVPELAEVSNG